jgi:MFS family permease
LQSLRVAPFRSFPWLEAKGVTGSLIGLNAAAYAASAMVSVMTIDQLTARVGENRVIAAALLGCSIGLAALAMTDSLRSGSLPVSLSAFVRACSRCWTEHG